VSCWKKPKDITKFESGAIRSSDVDHVRYDLIPPEVWKALAETYAEGAYKYGENNWKKGIPKGNLINHLYNHIEKYRLGDNSEPHLAHALWNVATLLYFEIHEPYAGWKEGR